MRFALYLVLFVLLISPAFAQEIPDLWPGLHWTSSNQGDTVRFSDANDITRLKLFYQPQSQDSGAIILNQKGQIIQTWSGKQRNPLFGTVMVFHKTQPIEICHWVNDQPTGPFETWYPQGNRKSKGQFEEGKKTGLWKQWYPAGKIHSTGQFLADVKDGRWYYYHRDSLLAYNELWSEGALQSVSDFTGTDGIVLPGGGAKNGNGQVFRYHLTGKRKQRFSLVQGLPEGEFWDYDSLGRPFRQKYFLQGELSETLTEFYPDSSRASQTHFEHGLENGPAYSWHANGKLAVNGWFRGGKEDSLWTEFDENGQLSAQYQFRQGLLVGGYITYFGNKSIQRKAWYIQGQQDSLFEEWNSKGIKTLEQHFRKGEKNGMAREWHPNGRLKSEGQMVADTEAGQWRTWFDNGRLQSEGKYAGGKPEGYWRTWFGNGKPATEGNYQNGQEEGTWKFYYPGGQLKSVEEWKDGRLMDISNALDIKGKKLNIGSFKQGNGTLKTYGLDGNLEGSGTMKNGAQDGEWTYYWPSGKIQARGGMKNGKRHGKWTYFYMGGEKAEESEYFFDEPIGTLYRFGQDGSLKESIEIPEEKTEGM